MRIMEHGKFKIYSLGNNIPFRNYLPFMLRETARDDVCIQIYNYVKHISLTRQTCKENNMLHTQCRLQIVNFQ